MVTFFSKLTPWQRWAVSSLLVVALAALLFSLFMRYLITELTEGALRTDELATLILMTRLAVAVFTFGGWLIAALMAARFFRTIARKELQLEHAVRYEVVNPLIHNLREPLAAAAYNLEVLKDKLEQAKLDKDVAEHIRIIGSANEFSRSVIRDLLTLGELHAGHSREHPQFVDLKELAWDVLNEYREAAGLKRISIGIEAPPNLPPLNVNRDALQTLLSVLMENAVSYTQEDGKISIRIFRKDANIVCEVADTGIGIPKEEQQQLFSRFFRGTNATVYKNVGTGAGLYIAKQILDDFGGKIWFVSEEGKGTTFSFSIPATLSKD